MYEIPLNKARLTEAFWKRSDGLQRLMTTAEHAAAKLILFKLVDAETDIPFISVRSWP